MIKNGAKRRFFNRENCVSLDIFVSKGTNGKIGFEVAGWLTCGVIGSAV